MSGGTDDSFVPGPIAIPRFSLFPFVREGFSCTKRPKTPDDEYKWRNNPYLEEVSRVFRESVVNCKDELDKVQKEHDGFQSQYYDEIDKIEAQYLHEIRPLCSKRMRLVCEGEDVEARIPRFWLSVMRAADDKLNMEITKRDEEALSYLKDIKYSMLNYPRGWKIEFVFDPNPYFENRILTIEFRYSWSRGTQLGIVKKGTDIKWYPGKCLTQKVEYQKSKKVVHKMIERVMVKAPSFFNSFMKIPNLRNQLGAFVEYVDLGDYEAIFCDTFTKWIIPEALSIFLGCSNMDVDQSLVEEFNELQKQFDACKLKMSECKLAAEDVYLKNVEPLHERRGNLIADGIPEFWLLAMRGEDLLSCSMISADDAKVLRYLKDIKFSRLDKCSGWKHEFFFGPNPYFKNSVLTKTIHTREDRWTAAVEKSTGTVIEWCPGSLFANVERPVKSFFNLFSERVEDLRLHDFMCKVIRGAIVPQAAYLYLLGRRDDAVGRVFEEYSSSEEKRALIPHYY